MAISWLVALKAVPWSDLVQAAPGIVKGARKGEAWNALLELTLALTGKPLPAAELP